MDKTQFLFGFVLSMSFSRMNCHSWIGPVGMGGGVRHGRRGGEHQGGERGRGGARGWTGEQVLKLNRFLLH